MNSLRFGRPPREGAALRECILNRFLLIKKATPNGKENKKMKEEKTGQPDEAGPADAKIITTRYKDRQRAPAASNGRGGIRVLFQPSQQAFAMN